MAARATEAEGQGGRGELGGGRWKGGSPGPKAGGT